MTSRKALKILILVLVVVGMSGLTVLGPSTVSAEGKSGPPTPTNVPRGGSGDKDGDHTLPELPRSTVSGYVYNYSEAIRAGGVKVILDGGEWQLEVVTDSNGYYRFGELGQGKSVLRLELPGGARSATPDWPLSLGIGEDIVANLGFFWGNDPPIPVLLSAGLSGSTLTVQVENRTVESATGARVDITLPTSLDALPGASTSQGGISYNDNVLTLSLGEITAGDVVITRIRLAPKVSVAPEGRGPGSAAPLLSADGMIQLVFTYDQQITPQRWLLNTDAMMLPSRAVPVSTPAAGLAESDSSTAVSTPTPILTPTSQPEVSVSLGEDEPDGMVSAQSVAADEAAGAAEELEDEAMSADSVVTEEEPEALPVSGGREPVHPLVVALPILLVAGLALAGWRSWRAHT